MLSTISSILNATANVSIQKDVSVSQDQGNKPAATPGADPASDSTIVKISAAAQQQAKRDAEAARVAAMTPLQLKAEATRLQKQIGVYSDADAARFDREVPDTDDPALLARAKQATAFFQHKAKNPFAGLSHEALAAIEYDDSGAYTVNERRAAQSEKQSQNSKHFDMVFALDALSGGDHRDLLRAIIEDYNRLSPLEKAAGNYPPNYIAHIKSLLEPSEEGKKHHGIVHSLLMPSPPLLQTTASLSAQSPVLNGSESEESMVGTDNNTPDLTDFHAIESMLLQIMSGKLNKPA